MTCPSRIFTLLTFVVSLAMMSGCGDAPDAAIDATVEARTQATAEAWLKTASPTRSLLTAIDAGNFDSVGEILDAGIDPNEDSVPEGFPLAGANPLHLAVVKGNSQIVQTLLTHGAKIDGRAKNKDEATPLHWSAFFGQKDMATLLIDSGAPINMLDSNHATPLDAAVFVWRLSQDDARKADHLMEMIEMLKNHGGKPADEL